MNIWIAIIGMALVTVFTRATPLFALRGELPEWLGRWLSYVPVTVFTALALRPLLISAETPPQLTFGPGLLAGLVAALAAWRSGNVLITIGVGFAAYWLIRLII